MSTVLDRPVADKDLLQFCDSMLGRHAQRRPQFPIGNRTLGPTNCWVDLQQGILFVEPARDWEFDPGQPFKVEIWRSGTSITRATAVILSVESKSPHRCVAMPLLETLNAIQRHSANYIRVWKV